MKIRSPDPILCLIIFAALGLRVLYALRPHVCFGDESCYLTLAMNLSLGAGYTYYDSRPELHFPPLFPLVLAGLNWIVRDWEAVSRVAYVIFGGLIPIPVYLVGRDLYSRRTGLIAAYLAAILPAFTSGVLFAETMSEPFFLLLLYTGVYFTCRAEASRRWAWCALAGAMFSLAFLTRPEAMAYFASMCLFYAIAVLFASSRPRGRLASAVAVPLAVMIVSFLIVASPYVLYLHSHTGSWFTTKDVTTYKLTRGLVHHDGVAFQRDAWGLNEKGEVFYYSQDVGQSLPGLLLGPYRGQVVSDIRENLSNLENVLLRPWVFGRVLLLLAAFGLFGSTWTSSRLLAEILNWLFIAPVAMILIFFVNERFLYPVLLPLLLWTALGIQHLLQWIQGTYLPGPLGLPRARTALQILLLCALTAYLARTGQRYFLKKTEETREVWEAAAWLKKNTPADAVVMATGPEVAFHAVRKWLPVPVASREDVIKYGQKRGATHLCIRGRYLTNRPEQKAELFDAAKSWDDLELLTKLDDGTTSFVVYRLKSPPGLRE